jgi:hypothetical protein
MGDAEFILGTLSVKLGDVYLICFLCASSWWWWKARVQQRHRFAAGAMVLFGVLFLVELIKVLLD